MGAREMTEQAADLVRVRAAQRRDWPARLTREPFRLFGEIPLGEQLRAWAQRRILDEANTEGTRYVHPYYWAVAAIVGG
jgi:hypothetical protein